MLPPSPRTGARLRRRARSALLDAPLAAVTVLALAVAAATLTARPADSGAALVEALGAHPSADVAPSRATAPPAPVLVPLERVLLVGDGIMFDLAPAVTATLGGSTTGAAATTVIDRSAWGLGLTRTDRYDWAALWRDDIASTNPQAVVITVGPNDATPIDVGGRLVAPTTAEWARRYADLLDVAAAVLVERGAHVYWLGMLPSGDASQRDAVDALDAAVRALAARNPAVTYVEPRDALGATYVERTTDTVPRRLRQPDGKHLCAEGAARVAPLVRRALSARFALPAADTTGTWRAEPRYAAGGPDCIG